MTLFESLNTTLGQVGDLVGGSVRIFEDIMGVGDVPYSSTPPAEPPLPAISPTKPNTVVPDKPVMSGGVMLALAVVVGFVLLRGK